MAESDGDKCANVQIYTIGGVKISFPYKAYASQISLMDKIVRSLNRRQNCLLESPTGTGKTLALLCASLAWQKKLRERIAEEDDMIKMAVATNGIAIGTPAEPSRDPCGPGASESFSPKNRANYSASSSYPPSAEPTNEFRTHHNQCDFKDLPSGVSTERSYKSSMPHISKAHHTHSPYFSASGEPPTVCNRNAASTEVSGQAAKPKSFVKVEPVWSSLIDLTDDEKDIKIPQNGDSPCGPNQEVCNTSSGSTNFETPLGDNKLSGQKCSSNSSPITPVSDCGSLKDSNSKGSAKRLRILYSVLDDDMNDFQEPKKHKSKDSSHCFVEASSMSTPISSPVTSRQNSPSVQEIVSSCASACASPEISKHNDSVVPKKLPKIFYGSRTHKQITQVIRELRKTCYKDSLMTILSSRDRTCIHGSVSKMANKREGCDEVLDAVGGPMCMHYRNYRNGVSHYISPCLSQAWDVEDLVKHLKRIRVCPYFTARALVAESDIVFCPYNYLIDPLVRSSLDIDLNGNIVIMDEAHNIEDFAREAASFTIKQQDLDDAIPELQQALYHLSDQKKAACFEKAISIFSALKSWLTSHGSILEKYSNFETGSKVYSGEEMIAMLGTAGISPENVRNVSKSLDSLCKQEQDPERREEEFEVKLSGGTLHLIKGILVILSYAFRDNGSCIGDYRCVVLRKKNFSYSQSMSSKSEWEISINFWCLNPAVAFTDLKGSVYSLLVASGTLSPMKSFETEIGMPFEITFAANHVVSFNQLWVGTIGRGPMGSALNGTFHNIETFSFQDEIGNLIFEVCNTVPHGVLCFVPSYSVLQKLSNRWTVTGLWDRLLTKKAIICEPRGGTEELETVMRDFYDAVDSDSGALLIAVCRGKVSEGMDFSDNHARAVITIGIPFPNIKDMQVDLKRKHNNSLCSKSNLMSGSDWYEAQAFRALNQALGRCIRHQKDFGALILVDERFQKNSRYLGCLSKWIRKELVHFPSCNDAMDSLKVFFEAKNCE